MLSEIFSVGSALVDTGNGKWEITGHSNGVAFCIVFCSDFLIQSFWVDMRH